MSRLVTARLVRRPALLGEVAVVVVLVSVYDRIRDIAATRADLAFADAGRLLRIESWAHVDVEHRLNGWLARHWHVEWLASVYYQLMHLSVTLGVLLWLYVARPGRYRSARTALVYISGLGLVVFWLMPVAPPRLLAGFVDSGAVTGIAQHTAHVSPDIYAAMPSLHVAWAAWVLLQVWPATGNRLLRGLAAWHGALTVLVVVATANHFLLDVVAGAATAVLATRLARAALVESPGGRAVRHVVGTAQAGRTGRRWPVRLPARAAMPSPASSPPPMPATPHVGSPPGSSAGRPAPVARAAFARGAGGDAAASASDLASEAAR
ncbi:MAG: phosphatase PAP2 family protein [Sporichthyaceae bacterium]